jgi:hypothetical protein
MKHQEKKFLVASFDDIKKWLNQVGANRLETANSTHYYAQVDGNDVVKLVDHDGRCEIHSLKESDGKFTLTDRIPVSDVSAGLAWLRDKGYKSCTKVKIIHTDYEYSGGLVGLYIVNDFLYSVILDFPADKHAPMEKQFGLEHAEQITIPYNKILENMGKIKPEPL